MRTKICFWSKTTINVYKKFILCGTTAFAICFKVLAEKMKHKNVLLRLLQHETWPSVCVQLQQRTSNHYLILQAISLSDNQITMRHSLPGTWFGSYFHSLVGVCWSHCGFIWSRELFKDNLVNSPPRQTASSLCVFAQRKNFRLSQQWRRQILLVPGECALTGCARFILRQVK